MRRRTWSMAIAVILIGGGAVGAWQWQLLQEARQFERVCENHAALPRIISGSIGRREFSEVRRVFDVDRESARDLGSLWDRCPAAIRQTREKHIESIRGHLERNSPELAIARLGAEWMALGGVVEFTLLGDLIDAYASDAYRRRWDPRRDALQRVVEAGPPFVIVWDGAADPPTRKRFADRLLYQTVEDGTSRWVFGDLSDQRLEAGAEAAEITIRVRSREQPMVVTGGARVDQERAEPRNVTFYIPTEAELEIRLPGSPEPLRARATAEPPETVSYFDFGPPGSSAIYDWSTLDTLFEEVISQLPPRN